MAGLQYNFFPTDFYYPLPAKPPPKTAATVPPQVITSPAVAAADQEEPDSTSSVRRGRVRRNKVLRATAPPQRCLPVKKENQLMSADVVFGGINSPPSGRRSPHGAEAGN
ncbi:hypothetical protein DM860_010591 [Cuscuta australis]|uniref:Uncharacterized protein n=1 Tax=Cuscuta australis TaxID=267555 RepID=A0A328E5Z3_9ASTE|nr:hypothetical protein DM860_010591 [Cuscuta australis]